MPLDVSASAIPVFILSISIALRVVVLVLKVLDYWDVAYIVESTLPQ